MANISVRKLDEEVIQQLKIQAVHHGVSMEEEARQILTRGIIVREGLGDAAVRLFGDLYHNDGISDNKRDNKSDDKLQIPTREVHQPLKF